MVGTSSVRERDSVAPALRWAPEWSQRNHCHHPRCCGSGMRDGWIERVHPRITRIDANFLKALLLMRILHGLELDGFVHLGHERFDEGIAQQRGNGRPVMHFGFPERSRNGAGSAVGPFATGAQRRMRPLRYPIQQQIAIACDGSTTYRGCDF